MASPSQPASASASASRATLDRSFDRPLDPALAAALASEGVEVFQTARVRERLAPAGPQLPAAYAATLSPLAIGIAGTGVVCTFSIRDGRVAIEPGAEAAATRVELSRASFEGLTRDLESTAGLIYGRRAEASAGDLMDFMQWEPALRWVYTGRPVYDPAAIDLRDRRGEPLDPTRSFRLDDDREEMAHFLRTTGFLFVRDVLSPDELARLTAEAEILRREAREGDQESWWGKRDDGATVLCRVLRAGKQPTMRSLHGDARIERLASLCDEPMSMRIGADEKDGVTLLWKQPGVVEGLGDLPWHRDCGLGGHASMCPTAVVSVFLGPNTPEAGELRFLPGSWQMSFPHQNADSPLAPRGVAPQARAGDVTIHYGDVLHVAPPPTGAVGPYRSCILLGYSRAGGGHHEGGRHYNDVLLGDETGQIADMRKVAGRA